MEVLVLTTSFPAWITYLSQKVNTARIQDGHQVKDHHMAQPRNAQFPYLWEVTFISKQWIQLTYQTRDLDSTSLLYGLRRIQGVRLAHMLSFSALAYPLLLTSSLLLHSMVTSSS